MGLGCHPSSLRQAAPGSSELRLQLLAFNHFVFLVRHALASVGFGRTYQRPGGSKRIPYSLENYGYILLVLSCGFIRQRDGSLQQWF
ncbi:hypothetical protein BDV11DRAFT_197732, partial [Aspergillus similis]